MTWLCTWSPLRLSHAQPRVPSLARAAPGCRSAGHACLCAAAMHVAAKSTATSRPVPTKSCPCSTTAARHLHAPGGAARRCQRTHGAVRTLCIATAGVGGAPEEGGGDGQPLWGKGSSDSPQAPPAAGRDPPRSGTGAAADSRSGGARSAWGLSSTDKALPLSLLYPYERLPAGDKVRRALVASAVGVARHTSAVDTLRGRCASQRTFYGLLCQTEPPLTPRCCGPSHAHTPQQTQFSLHQPCSVEKDGSCKLDTQVR